MFASNNTRNDRFYTTSTRLFVLKNRAVSESVIILLDSFQYDSSTFEPLAEISLDVFFFKFRNHLFLTAGVS